MWTDSKDVSVGPGVWRRTGRTGRMLAAIAGVTFLAAACAGADPAADTDETPDAVPTAEPSQAVEENPLEGLDEVRIIVPLPPGGGFDIEARMLTTHLEKALEEAAGRSIRVYVENVPGGEGRVGAQQVFESDRADILYYSTPILINGQLDDGEQAVYDVEQFRALGAWGPGGRAAIKRIDLDLPAEGLDGLSERSQELPLLWGHTGLEPDSRLMSLLLGEEGTDLHQDFVYHDGIGDAISSLLRGDTEILYTTTSTLVKQVEGNPDELEFVAQTSCDRSPAAAEVPTVVDLEWPNADQICASQTAPRAFLAPPGISDGLAAALSGALMSALESQELADEAEKANQPIEPMGGDRVQELITARLEFFKGYPELTQN